MHNTKAKQQNKSGSSEKNQNKRKELTKLCILHLKWTFARFKFMLRRQVESPMMGPAAYYS